MAADLGNYADALQQVLDARKEWLERSEMGKLKENLRAFQTSFTTLYNIFLKKKILNEDPYKQETKISELEVPDSSAFQDAKRLEQLSLRLSNYDSQLDFLVNFYQLGMDFLNLDRIKRIVGLIRYIDWINLTPDNQNLMTKAVAEMMTQAKVGVDTLTLNIIGECLTKLSKTTALVINTLKDLNTYSRESYKLSVRQNVTKSMAANEANMENIKKKMSATMQGAHFYKELIEEIIKEDYSSSGPDLRETLLNSLKIPEEKQKTVKQVINYKNILLEGIQAIGGASGSLNDICAKFEENQNVMESIKKGFIYAIKELIRQITHAEPEEVVYFLEYMDTTNNTPVKEKVSFRRFIDDVTKKSRLLSSFVKGSAYNKLTAMTEDQIIGYLEKNIRDVQALHKTMNAMDDHFKANAPAENREAIKGIKPELLTLKNIIVRANQLRYEYSAQKEEEEQMKRLRLTPAEPPASS